MMIRGGLLDSLVYRCEGGVDCGLAEKLWRCGSRRNVFCGRLRDCFYKTRGEQTGP